MTFFFLVETEKPILKSIWNLKGALNSQKKNVEKEQSLKSQIYCVLKYITNYSNQNSMVLA